MAECRSAAKAQRRIRREERQEERRQRAEERRERAKEKAQTKEQIAALQDPIHQTAKALFNYYSSDDFVNASGYVADRWVRTCGGALKFASAYRQMKEIEQLNYTLEDVNVTKLKGGRAFADVTESAYDVSTGQRYDKHFILGLWFVRDPTSPTGWVFEEPFPLGVETNC